MNYHTFEQIRFAMMTFIHIAQLIRFDQDRMEISVDAAVRCDGERIVWVGRTHELPPADSDQTVDCRDLVCLPGLIDSHTHSVFAGSREHEFELKLQGAGYAEIAARGGGILNTMTSTRHSSKEHLLQIAIRHARAALAFGITTLEIKSGYGLSVDDEIKMLEVIRDLPAHVPIETIATFLGAHAVPPEYKDRREAYVALVCEEMIPRVAAEKLASFCDVFCETNVFTPDETRQIFAAAKKHQLKLKLHADQLTNTGGAELCAEMGAVSADHLENISDRGIEALARSGVVAGLLPGCSFYLNMQYPPARRLITAGIPIALATDFNPGSCPTQNLPLIMTIACTQMKMTPAEVLRAVTVNAAKSVSRGDIGNIAPGMQADLAFFDVPSYTTIPYRFGQNHCTMVVKRGKIAHRSPIA
jgi:imidazolonepropionase